MIRVLVLLLATAFAGCGVLSESDSPPPSPPAEVAPAAPEAPSAPVEPAPAPETQQDSPPAAPRTGSFTIPGLEGVAIPLPAPQGEYSPPEPPARNSLPPAPPESHDRAGFITPAFLQARVESIHQTLLSSLDEREQGRVRGIPLVIERLPATPNAAAICARGVPRMMITTGMLELVAGISEAKAFDELADTDTYGEYVASVVAGVRSQRPIEGVAPRLHQGPTALDPHKLSRQLHLMDQQLAFILGHELAHHYLGHTHCVEGRSDAELQRDRLGRILAHTIPTFSQPREVEADMWGLTNVLEAGHGRPQARWTEEGGLLNLDFFRRLSDRGGAELVLAFLSTHPPSIVRIPIVQATAQQWSHDWRPPRMPVPGQGPLNLPLPGGGPIQLPAGLPIDPSRLPLPLPLPTGR